MMNVYFTVDTESSMAGAWRDPNRRPLTSDRHIFCRIGEQDYGIGLITRLLAERGFRATHFVETLAALVNGEADTAAVFDYLLEHGQDVQLHVHPTYRFYAEALAARTAGRPYHAPEPNDFIGQFDETLQLELLEQAAAIYRKLSGRNPVAFRAGSYAANRTTLRCLHRLGILLDASFNPCYREWSFPGEHFEPNRVCKIEGVIEVPVTVARTPLPESTSGLKPADPCALSVRELRTMLETGAAQGQRHFVIVFHSFSAVKAKDDSYTQIRPDRLVITRLQKLIDYLAAHPDLYRVSTFSELARFEAALEHPAPSLAELTVLSAGMRKSVQAINRYYWI